MPSLRETYEWQSADEVLRVDCLGNLVDDMSEKILVPHEDVPAFLDWLTNEFKRVKKFGVVTETGRG